MIRGNDPSPQSTLRAELKERSGWAHVNPIRTQVLDDILATVDMASFPGAIIPRLKGGRMIYYAVADSGRDWRMLQGLLRSFVGTTLSDFQGQPARLDPSDPFEAFLLDRFPGSFGRFSPGGTKALEAPAVEALARMVRLVEGEGRVRRTVPRSTRQVLNEFRLALAGGNDRAAGEALDFLREHMRLDALNLYFLEVERYQARQDWEGLVSAHFFPVLADVRRPPRVTNAMLEALYFHALVGAISEGDIEKATTAYEEHVRGPYGSLLRVLPPQPSPGVALLFLMDSYLQKKPDAHVVTAVQTVLPKLSDAERAVAAVMLRSLADIGAPASGTKVSQQAAQPTDEAVPATTEGALAAVMNALETGSLSSFRQARAYVERLAEAERQTLFSKKSFQTLWKALQEAVGEQRVPSSWLELLQMLPTLRYSEVKALAQRAQVEWSVAETLATPEDAARLSEAIQEAWSGETRDALTNLIPYLVEWVAQDEAWPNPICLPLYESLLVCLNLSDQYGQGLLDATSTLTYGCLRIGLSATAYRSLLTDLGERAEVVAGVTTADWLLDVGEQVLILPCPDREARTAFWARAQGALTPILSRLVEGQLELFHDVSTALGLPYPRQVGPRPHVDEATTRGRMLAVYTLQESVATRVKSILARLAPEVRVEVCTDLVATDRVKHLARTADLFVVCWQDAKHAVTREITRLRPRQKPIHWATGAGSAGVLRSLRECWPLP